MQPFGIKTFFWLITHMRLKGRRGLVAKIHLFENNCEWNGDLLWAICDCLRKLSLLHRGNPRIVQLTNMSTYHNVLIWERALVNFHTRPQTPQVFIFQLGIVHVTLILFTIGCLFSKFGLNWERFVEIFVHIWSRWMDWHSCQS